MEGPAEDRVGRGAEGDYVGGGSIGSRSWGPLADGRCSKAVLGFPSTTDVGRLVPAEEDAGSEVSEWERRECREREEERRVEAEELSDGGGGYGFLLAFAPAIGVRYRCVKM